MDSLFGIPLVNILIALVAMVAAIFAVLAWIGFRNPLLVKMGLRNLLRRKTQTVLIVIGLMLSTLIISAAFATGDTVGYSVTNTVYEELGEADLLVVFDRERAEVGRRMTDEDVRALEAIGAADPDIDAVSGLIQLSIPALNPEARLSEPQASVVGLHPDTSDGLNGLVTEDGVALSVRDLGEGEAYITRNLADEILAETGSTVTIRYEGQPYDFVVAGIVRDNALSAPTQGGGAGGPPPSSGGGVIIPIEAVRSFANEADSRVNLIVISAVGGVRDTLDRTRDIEERLEGIFEAQNLPLQVALSKAEFVEFAELAGSLFVTFFLVFGLFSIAAGIMLIFLTFVMLAAERRGEMGMARAVGMKRLHLTQSFIAEGMAYNIGSALVGAVLGLGVAWVLIAVLGSLAEDFGLGIAFHVSPVGFVISYCLGLVITFLTVAIASWRSANLNIVRAIRDIPEPEPLKGKDTSAKGLLLATVGAAWYLVWVGILALAGVALFFAAIASLALFGIPLLAVGLLLAAFVWGLRQFGRARGLRRNIGLALWWVAFSVVGLVAFFLLKTRRWADRHRTSGGWAVLMLVIGALATWWGGWVSGQAFAYTAGTTLMLLAVAMLAVYFGAPQRPTFAIISAVTIWYWLLPMPFNLLFDGGQGWTDPLDGLFGLVGLGHEPITGNIEMFFVSGVCITAASTLFVIFNADRLLGTLGLLRRVLGGITPAVRTAVSYPLAAKFRTGMTLAMFTLVMFSLVVMATLNHNFTQLFFGEKALGGWDVMATANRNNPIPDLEVALTERGYDVQANIAGIGRMVTGQAEMRPADEDDEFFTFPLSGIDPGFVEHSDFAITTWAAGYSGSEEVMAAFASDPDVAVVNEGVFSFTQRANFQNPDNMFSIEGAVGDLVAGQWEPIPVTLRDENTGEERTVRVIGVVDSAIISGIVPAWYALIVPEVTATEAMEDYGQTFFATTVGGSDDALDVAQAIESTLLEEGVQGQSLRATLQDLTAVNNAFSTLFVAFMSLGLVVGIAALGVIAFRTVAERRQQIGMLRAIGYTRRLVAISFFLESSFIAITGIAMGLILGGALSYNLMTSPEFTNGQEVAFSFPVGTILVIVAIAYFATAVMTLIPARSASRVAVAEALRYSA